MGNPIQYHNTDNPSQIIFKCGGLPQQGGGVVTTTYHCDKNPVVFDNGKAIVVCPPPPPPRAVPQRGVNENFTPAAAHERPNVIPNSV